MQSAMNAGVHLAGRDGDGEQAVMLEFTFESLYGSSINERTDKGFGRNRNRENVIGTVHFTQIDAVRSSCYLRRTTVCYLH